MSYAAQASYIATERVKRLRACTGGLGVSMRMAERICSSQTRAMLWEADAKVTKPELQPNSKARRTICITPANRVSESGSEAETPDPWPNIATLTAVLGRTSSLKLRVSSTESSRQAGQTRCSDWWTPAG